MDWDKAYSNIDQVADAASYPPRWLEIAAAFRADHPGEAQLDLPYGDAPREKLDLFLPSDPPKGLAIFVHGGYWMKFDKNHWSHLAGGALAHGWAVAVPQYTLCPDIRITGITRQIGAAINLVARQVDGPIRLAGHSAGGHLVTRMVCSDSPLRRDVQVRLGPVLSISGVHDLRPLLHIQLNDALDLDEGEATAESPALNTPLEGTQVTCWVGADELPEFIRQNALLANIWTGLGAQTHIVEEENRHHFNVIDGLADPDAALTRAWIDA